MAHRIAVANRVGHLSLGVGIGNAQPLLDSDGDSDISCSTFAWASEPCISSYKWRQSINAPSARSWRRRWASRIEDTPAGRAGGRRWIWSSWTEVLPSGCDRCRLKSHFAFPSFWFLPSTCHNSLVRSAIGVSTPATGTALTMPGETLGRSTHQPGFPAGDEQHGLVLWDLSGLDHGAQRSGPRPGNEVFALRDKTGTRHCLVVVRKCGSPAAHPDRRASS